MRPPRPVRGLEGPFYRVSEIALALGVDPTTVLRWIHRGELEAERQGGDRGMFLVPQSAIDNRSTRRPENESDPELAITARAGA